MAGLSLSAQRLFLQYLERHWRRSFVGNDSGFAQGEVIVAELENSQLRHTRACPEYLAFQG